MYAPLMQQQLPILLFISFDGFRHDYLKATLTPNLFALSKQATVGNMESMYITKTFPNHFSMATGLFEDEHEMINNKMFDPRLNETFKPGVISSEWWNPRGNAMPIWIANELVAEKFLHQQRFSGSMMYPGSSTPYFNTLPTHLHDYQPKANWTENIETVISWLTDSKKAANFVSIYFDEPDTIAHWHGPWAKETLDAVRQVDQAAGYLIKRLNEVNLADKTNIIFVSDHGMAEMKTLAYFSDFLDMSAIDLYGNSPDWSVFVKPEKRHLKAKIYQDLVANSKKNHYRVFKRSEIPPEMHYSKSPRIGDFFILVDEKYDLFPTRPPKSSNNNKNYPVPKIWGNHGWNPKDPDMRPLFMAYGPVFKKNYNHPESFPNIDLFPLMSFLLDLPAIFLPNNGSLARIIDVIELAHLDDNSNRIVSLVQ